MHFTALAFEDKSTYFTNLLQGAQLLKALFNVRNLMVSWEMDTAKISVCIRKRLGSCQSAAHCEMYLLLALISQYVDVDWARRSKKMMAQPDNFGFSVNDGSCSKYLASAVESCILKANVLEEQT